MDRIALLAFLRKHRLGVLATVSPTGEPESAVVGIAFTNNLELVFDTIDNTRKCQNLRKFPRIAFVIGWDEEITVQYEGIADEPNGAELEGLKDAYFAVYPDGRERQKWPGITYFRVRPTWARYSDFNSPGTTIEFTKEQLRADR
ncbi:MAG TPA: pyridoxamine 5'-phosphate oxidase family protein [Candidatus Acidoferrales bacterium]|nr:pyridoxamine 5'-phosphate oxidase family protein [Candidatus Acidoferrales bacterium]